MIYNHGGVHGNHVGALDPVVSEFVPSEQGFGLFTKIKM